MNYDPFFKLEELMKPLLKRGLVLSLQSNDLGEKPSKLVDATQQNYNWKNNRLGEWRMGI